MTIGVYVLKEFIIISDFFIFFFVLFLAKPAAALFVPRRIGFSFFFAFFDSKIMEVCRLRITRSGTREGREISILAFFLESLVLLEALRKWVILMEVRNFDNSNTSGSWSNQNLMEILL